MSGSHQQCVLWALEALCSKINLGLLLQTEKDIAPFIAQNLWLRNLLCAAWSTSRGPQCQHTCCLCLQAVLGRWARQEEVVCGSATLGRNRPELKNLFGYFVDMLPLRTSLAGQQSFKQLVSQMRQTFLEGLEHSDVPFGKLVEALNVPRTAAYSPVFQAICWLKEEAAIAHVEDFPSIGFHFLGRMVSLFPISAGSSGKYSLSHS